MLSMSLKWCSVFSHQHNGGRFLVKSSALHWWLHVCLMTWIIVEQIILFKSSKSFFSWIFLVIFNFLISFSQSFISSCSVIFNINNGTSSFRSMSYDFKQSRKFDSLEFIIRWLQSNDTGSWRCDLINWFGCLF